MRQCPLGHPMMQFTEGQVDASCIAPLAPGESGWMQKQRVVLPQSAQMGWGNPSSMHAGVQEGLCSSTKATLGNPSSSMAEGG